MQSVQIPQSVAVPPGFRIMRDRMLCERTQDEIEAEGRKQTWAKSFGDRVFSSFYLKFVTRFPGAFGIDQVVLMVFDLFPETFFNVDIYCAGIPNVFISPDVIRRLLDR